MKKGASLDEEAFLRELAHVPERTLPHGEGASGGEAPASGELVPGATLGRYVILKHIGHGGMGIVYLAFDGELERRVAIKVLRAEASAGVSAGETRARLLREAQAMAKVSHSNVVSVYDVGTFGDNVFIAMEYVRGTTLREWRYQPKRRPRALVAMYIQAGRGLAAAHAAGILHRDFKPDNVLVDEQGQAKVLDFGLARLEARTGEAPEKVDKIGLTDTGIDHKAGLATPITRVGSILGTPAYMAPEQILGETATARSDQFAFCVALYEAICGALPFEGESLTTLASNIYSARIRQAPGGASCPRGVRRVLVRGLNGAPGKRFASMTELLEALEEAVRAPARWLTAAGVAAVVTGVTALALLRPGPPKLCRGAEQALAPGWSAARENEVHRAFARSGNARAEEAFAHTSTVLERYARSWVAMHTETCEATRVRGEQSEATMDLRMACLAQRERELKATVDLLADPDEKTIDNAVGAASQLTPVASCADVESLRSPFAPPKDEGQRRAVDELRRELAELDAQFELDRTEGVEAKASALVEQAGRLGYEPVRSEALYEQGYIARYLQKTTLAEDALFQAALSAEAGRHDGIAAKAWTLLVKVQARDLGHFADADRTTLLADAAVRRANSDDLRADLLSAKAEADYQRGATSEMRTYAEECIRLRERLQGATHPATLLARQLLADALWDSGEVEASLPVYREIFDARRTLLGPTHPQTLRSLSDVGTVTFELGDYATAIPMLEETARAPLLPLARASFKSYLAEALVGAGRVDEGIATFAEAHTLAVGREGPNGPDVLDIVGDFGRLLVEREADAQAEAEANEALEILKTAGREQSRGEALGVRALVEARRGDAKRAIDDASGALTVKEKLLGERAEIIPLLARGMAYLATHREADALVDLERAASLGDKHRGDLAVRAEVRFALARALVASKGDKVDPARARDLATRAASELDSVGLKESAKRARQWSATVITAP
ncbi:MAG: protein kinase domain-containing protein [Polyangiaceae bacterium]